MSPAALAEALAGLPPLGVTLSELARHIPRRIQVSSPPYGQMADITLIYDAGWDLQFAQDAPNERDLLLVEMALREEIEARGWQWRVRARFPVGTGYWARVDTHPGQLADYPGYEGSADSPAHALSLALLAALGAPAGAGA